MKEKVGERTGVGVEEREHEEYVEKMGSEGEGIE